MKRAVTLVALAFALAGCSNHSNTPPDAPVDWGSPQDYAQELFKHTNEQRAQEGLGQLTWNDCLATKALPRAQKTLPEDTLEHEPLSTSCIDGSNAANGTKAGENLTRGPYAPAEAVVHWMDSPGHRANILDPDFTITGIACVAFSYTDNAREAQAGEDIGGYACSQLFEGIASS